jgi:hypothetical protein
MRRTPNLQSQQAFVIQSPSTDAGGILRISYRLSLVVQNGCGSKLKVAIPMTFAATYPERGLPVPVLPSAAATEPVPMPVRGILEFGFGFGSIDD